MDNGVQRKRNSWMAAGKGTEDFKDFPRVVRKQLMTNLKTVFCTGRQANTPLKF